MKDSTPRITRRRVVVVSRILLLLSSLLTTPLNAQDITETVRVAPTDIPSTHPTNVASMFPTIAPSMQPTSMPSESPTSNPSLHPSRNPSDDPTNLPSQHPSLQPTIMPSLSEIPTIAPSVMPTLSTHPSKTVHPSNAPSGIPSTTPTEEHSNGPSIVPSMAPSNDPSVYPSVYPSISSGPSQSFQPSTTPSSSPSDAPSRFPTLSPAPSYSPSTAPSVMPSIAPTTGMPSSMPSFLPSSPPSDKPSSRPSASPSSMPSSSPTLTCHDTASYRSPINGLTCADHSGTDCYQWRNIGLNTTELGDLINNCPETCNIPCGAFVDFSIPVSYRLTGIPGLLDDSSKISLEQASFDYILSYIEDARHEHIFELDMVELSSQSLVTPERKLVRRQVQEVAQATVDEIVLVTVVFDGFSIGMTYNEISDLLVAGMNSTGFTIALQDSDRFFATAVISSAETKDDTVHEPDEDERDGPSSATVLVFILVVLGVGLPLSFALLHRRKLKAWFFGDKLREAPSNTDSDSMPSSQQGRPRFISIDMTPRVGSESMLHRFVEKVNDYLEKLKASGGNALTLVYPALPIQNSDSQASRLSHQGSPVNDASLFSFENSTTNISNISVANNNGLRGLTTGTSISTEPGVPIMKRDMNEKILGPSDTISPMSEVTEDSIRSDLSLQNVIPPMIVVENIDDTPTGLFTNTNQESLLAQGKRTEESSSVHSALQRPPSISTMVVNFPELNAWHNHDAIPHALSPLGIIVDSDSEDDTSCSSTPVRTETSKSDLSNHSRSLSGTALDKLHSAKSPLHLLTLQQSSSYSEDGIGCLIDPDGDASVELVFKRSKSLRSQVSPIEEPSGHDRGGLINSIWAMNPNAIMGTPQSSKKSPGGKIGLLKRRLSNSSIPECPAVVRNTETVEMGNRLAFEAPRTGQLGLVIEARSNSGPVVHAVKDYSPLFGKIETGDKIFEIDGKNQTGATLSDVMHLLASKSGRRLSNSHNLKIVVDRDPTTAEKSGVSNFESSDRTHEDIDSKILDLRWPHRHIGGGSAQK